MLRRKRTDNSKHGTRLIVDVVTGKLDVREAVANLADEVETLGYWLVHSPQIEGLMIKPSKIIFEVIEAVEGGYDALEAGATVAHDPDAPAQIHEICTLVAGSYGARATL